jgi:hypothetical protein
MSTISLSLPFFLFWVIIIFARHELGWRGGLIAVGIWLGLLVGFVFLNLSPYIFVGVQALEDIILILVIFKGDIRIN